jgi:hypothetical protein
MNIEWIVLAIAISFVVSVLLFVARARRSAEPAPAPRPAPQRLVRLIRAYLQATGEAVAALDAAGIARPASALGWSLAGIPHEGRLIDDRRYRKHGFGCTVELPSGSVDFDFGPEGQIDGFDAGRLAFFAKGRLEHFGYASAAQIEQDMQSAIRGGAVVSYEDSALLHLRDA